MHFISNLIISVTDAYTLLIFVYVLMSWLPNTVTGWVGEVYRALGKLCDPFLDLFRKYIPPIGGVVDISPIVALLVLQLVAQFIVYLL